MRQFIGSVRDDTNVQRFLVDLSPPAVREAWDAMEAAELALMETDDERGADGLRARALALGRRRRLRRRGHLGHRHRRRARRPLRPLQVPRAVDAVRRGAEAAGAGGAAARAGRGAAARRAGQLPRRPGQAVARGAAARDPQDRAVRQPRPGAARPRRRPGGHRRGRDRLGARRRVRQLPRGPGVAARPDGRAPAAVGRGAPAADRSRPHAAAAGGELAGHGQPLPRDADPAGEVRGRRAATGAAAGAEGRHAAARRPDRRARGDGRAAGADRADAAVRHRDLLRRAGGRAGGQRGGQVALPPAAGR